jgi:hypothetical protein
MAARTPNTSGIKYFLGFDVEGSGQCMKTNFMPRFGLALVEIATGQLVERYGSFVKPPTPEHGWELRCLEEFWLKKLDATATPKQIEDARQIKLKYEEIIANLPSAPTPDEAGLAFVEWINKLVAKYGKTTIMLASDTAGYDYAWLSSILPAGTSLLYLFGEYRPTFAVSNFYGGVAGLTPTKSLWGLFNACVSKLGIEKPACANIEHDHNPMNDAATIAYEAAAIVRFLDSQAELAANFSSGYAESSKRPRVEDDVANM